MSEYARTLIKKGQTLSTTETGQPINLFQSSNAFTAMTTPRFFSKFPATKNITALGYSYFLDQKVFLS